MPRRGQYRKPTRYWRCPRCNTPVPRNYETCGACDATRATPRRTRENDFIEHAKQIFPGSYEP